MNRTPNSDASSGASDRIIETYVQRLLAWEAPLTSETLTSLATDVGLSEADIEAVERQAQAHLARGRNYLSVDCLDDAIEELTQATTLSPLNLDAIHSLSEAYSQRYQAKKSSKDKAKSIALAKRALEIQPSDQKAAATIKSLEPQPSWLSPQQVGANVLKFAIAASVISGVGFLVWWPIHALESGSNAVTSPSSSSSLERAAESPSASAAAEVDIPVEFEAAGLTVEARLSRLKNYEKKSFYELQAVLINDGQQEIDALRLKVEYFDANGTVIAADDVEAVRESGATLRPGDQSAFKLLEEITPQLAKLRLSMTTIDQLPASESYAEPAPVAYEWDASQPPQISFALGSRSESFTSNFSNYFDAEWAATNTGDTAIRGLKLRVDFFDKRNQLIVSNETYVVAGSGAPMLPGDVRPIRVIKEVSEDYERYEVFVIEAD